MAASISLRQYSRFLTIGGLVGVLTLAAREFFGWVLGGDTPARYSASIIMAYALGIVCSFLLNRRYTFDAGHSSADWLRFGRFVLVALLGMVLTWLLSLALRYGLRLDVVMGHLARPAAFAAATVMGSLATYPVNAWLVFGERSATRA